MGRTVSLWIRVYLEGGKRQYCIPVWTGKKKDRLRAGYALIGGKEVWHPEGIYCLRFELDGKRQWETVGKDPEEALDRLSEREKQLRAMDRGIQPPVAPAPSKGNSLLKDAIEKYLTAIDALRSPKTMQAYRFALNQFREAVPKQRVGQIDKNDLNIFAGWLREHGSSDRTIHNKLGDVVAFLRANDIKDVTISYKFTEKKVKAYRESELKALFNVCSDEEWITFQFFLGTGFREQEVSHACWNDVNFEDHTVTVRENKQLGFRPKDREERTVPVPDALLELLQARREIRPSDWLIFPGAEGKPEGHFLRTLKERAFTAGLNCGHCRNRKGLSCKDQPVCELWILHRFRKSFATLHHENGVSARAIQGWLGHSSLDTTLRYLADVELGSSRTRQQVNSSFAVFKRDSGDD